MLELGPIEQNIAKQACRMGQPLPDNIANAPELRYGLNLYLQAFFDLDSERSHGFSLTRIPWLSIRDYAMANQFDETQTEDLAYFIRSMDVAHLERLEAKTKKD